MQQPLLESELKQLVETKYIHIYSEPCNIINTNNIPDEDFVLSYVNYKYGYDIISKNDRNNKLGVFYDTELDFNPYNSRLIVYQFIDWKTNRELSDISRHDMILYMDTCKMHNSLPNNIIIVKLHKQDDAYFMNYYINKKYLKTIFNKDCMVKYITLLMKKIKNQEHTKNCLLYLQDILNTVPNSPVLDGPVELEPVGPDGVLKDNISLYKYQIQDIKWMRKIENNVDKQDNTISFDYSLIYTINIDGVDCSVYNDILLPKKYVNTNMLNIKKSLHYYGGNLINTMGLGKTITVLYHLFSKYTENIYDYYLDYSNTCNYFFKRGKKHNTVCGNPALPSSLYCQVHSDTLFIDKKHFTLKNLDYLNLQNSIIKAQYEKKLRTHSSIIICPNQLCDQWVREYYEKFKVNKRILLIITYDQYKNITLADILFSDLIIVSFNFLINTNYLNHVKASKDVVSHIHNYISGQNEEETKKNLQELLNKKGIFTLDNFYYNTVVIDEIHELNTIPKKSKIKDAIFELCSTYKWNISGTPFANGVVDFITEMNFITNSYCDTFDLDKISKLIIASKPLYRRNTKESIQYEKTFSIINETCKMLEFTNQERTIYNSYANGRNNYDYLIKLCCHPEIDKNTRQLVQNCKNLDEIQQVLLEHNKKKMSSLHKKIKKYTLELTNLQTSYENELDNSVKNNLKNEISIIKRHITNESKELDSVTKVYNYLLSVISSIDQSETCPICLDDTSVTNLAITQCGHKFCWECITEYLKSLSKHNPKCPKCNIPITLNQIYKFKQNTQNSNNSISDELNYYIQETKSTKLGNIIYYIKHLQPNDKCIVFSQWDEMIDKISVILKKEGIGYVSCSGTVYQKKRAIESFKSDPSINIIFLSMKYSASGINLTEANKIILIEPVYGSKEHRDDIESQSIGRSSRISQTKPIEVIRFIIKDTIEEELYLSNHDTKDKPGTPDRPGTPDQPGTPDRPGTHSMTVTPEKPLIE